jgi:GT2 family glycosyltransferase
MALASVLFLTLDRHELTKRTLTANALRAGYPFELLACDQGSSDDRNARFINSLYPEYFRMNSRNEGVGKAFNQLFLRSKGDYIVLLGNDLECQQNWLSDLVKYLDAVPDSGLASLHWGHGSTPPLSEKFGVKAHFLDSKLNRCFGVTAFRRAMVDKIGLFHEGYREYGLEDSDLNERVNRAGFNSFYIPNHFSLHLDNDYGQTTPYRRAKDEAMAYNLGVFQKRVEGFDRGEGLVDQLPAMRDAI